MTHLCTPPAAPTSRGLFVSGIVLGLSLGFAAGHLLLFNPTARQAKPTVETDSESELDEFLESSFGAPPLETADVPADIQFSLFDLDADPPVGRARLSDADVTPIDDGDGLHFFPAAVRCPAEDTVDPQDSSLAFADKIGFEEEAAGDAPLRMTAEVPHDANDSESVPQALQPAPSAAPIDERTSEREAGMRQVIQSELPQATADEWEVWEEVLSGLSVEDVRGILRLRKRIGPGHTPLLSTVETTIPSKRPPGELAKKTRSLAAKTERPSATHAALRTLRQLWNIQRHNLANSETIAFRARVAVTREALASDEQGFETGLTLVRTQPDMTPGRLMSTDRPLDVAIDGRAFLQVRRGDDVRLTRDGRLTLTTKRQLCLAATNEEWLITPPLTLPAATVALHIAANGKITATLAETQDKVEVGVIPAVLVLNPTGLRVDDEGLYAATEISGSPVVARFGTPETGTLQQGHLEESNVDASAVLDELDRLEQLMQLYRE